jgi:hypothetical protein
MHEKTMAVAPDLGGRSADLCPSPWLAPAVFPMETHIHNGARLDSTDYAREEDDRGSKIHRAGAPLLLQGQGAACWAPPLHGRTLGWQSAFAFAFAGEPRTWMHTLV